MTITYIKLHRSILVRHFITVIKIPKILTQKEKIFTLAYALGDEFSAAAWYITTGAHIHLTRPGRALESKVPFKDIFLLGPILYRFHHQYKY